ncbi:hypothetical protein [Paenibacillus oleatilyticus]|uniref:hypothetical protein n=1 Tax=Paenibacillus oleatilyticus TaxID=2594886 RepID=UPI0027BA3052|nr:hypothetical protein [Paenibacillus oleatilyticus]
MISLIASATPIPPFAELCWSFRCQRNGGRKHRGDVSAGAAEAVKAVSPVPGGVGTLTTAILPEMC